MARVEEKPMVAAECHGVKVPQSPLLTPTRTARINDARYEGHEIAGALAVINPGDRVLEMGAGLGLVGAIVAKKTSPAAVLSFEANPLLIPHIQALYDLNGLEDVISLHNQVIVSAPNSPDTLPFHIRSSFLGSSLIDRNKRVATRVDVPTVAYDAVRQSFQPNVLLMDIEGGELEFLRYASLDGLRAVVMEFHPEVYGKEGMRKCKSILERAGFRKVPGVCTRHVWACTLEPESRPPTPVGGWSTEITSLEGAMVVPSVDEGFVQPAGVLHADGRYCPQGALWRNGRALTTAPERPHCDLPMREGTWLWGGVLWKHFGHFLVESTSRLWALDQIDTNIDGILFIPKRPRKGGDVAGFQQDFVNLMGCDKPVVSLDGPCRVERLIVPGQGFGLHGLITGTQGYRDAIARRFACDINPEGPDRLYISRSKLPPGRGNLIGERALEEALSAQGYTIFHPEKHDLRSQVAVYKAARQIIAAEGSALHLLAMVLQADQKVAIVVRRPSFATRQLEKHLRAFAGTEPVMLCQLTRSWKPPGKARSRLWMGELDMPALQNDLVRAGFITWGKTRWKSLDAAEVKAQLGEGFEMAPERG
jgi:FkbM family methyltransferase